MGFLDKVKGLAEKTVVAASEAAVATKKAYQEGGLEQIGFEAGKLTKQAVDSVSSYTEEVAKEVKKAGKPAGIAFNKDQPNAKAAAKVALGVIAGMRKIGLDSADKLTNVADEFNNLDKPKSNKP